MVATSVNAFKSMEKAIPTAGPAWWRLATGATHLFGAILAHSADATEGIPFAPAHLIANSNGWTSLHRRLHLKPISRSIDLSRL